MAGQLSFQGKQTDAKRIRRTVPIRFTPILLPLGLPVLCGNSADLPSALAVPQDDPRLRRIIPHVPSP